MVIKRKQIDETDSKILHALLMESRTSFTELAEMLDISVTAVLRRYNLLKKMGIIIGEHMHLNPLSVGCESMAEVGIMTDLTDKQKAAEILSNRKLSITRDPLGKYDIYGDLLARRTDELLRIVQRLDLKPYVKSLDVLIYADVDRSPWHPENLCIKQFDCQKSLEKSKRQADEFKPVSLDERDICIIKMLVENSRIPFKDLAKQTNIPIKSVFQKYNALREKNVLYLSTIAINPVKMGFEAVFDLYITVENRGMLSEVEERLCQIPNMTFCTKFIGGSYDLRAAILVSDITEIFDVKKTVCSFKNIRKMEYYLHEIPSSNCWFSNRRSLDLIKQMLLKCENQ